MCPRSTPGSQALPRKGAHRVVVCLCRHARVLDEGLQARVLEHLAQAGATYEVAQDLCGLAGRRDERLRVIADAPGACIVACFPRAVRALFELAGAPLDPERSRVLNLRAGAAEPIEEILSALPGSTQVPGAQAGTLTAPADDTWVPWFPAIDYARCKDCRKCLSFCLFGVYALGPDGRVAVQNPANCKLNCPACARVCPEAAIIFPKYKGAPFNGAEVTPEDTRREAARVDVSGLARGNVYEALRKRTGGAEGSAPGASGQAPRPKQAAGLKELQQQLDIPSEVIDSLVGRRKPKQDEPRQP